MSKLEITYLPLSEITPYAKNPRKNKKAIDGVAASIRAVGFRNPIVLDKNNEIVCGHTRYAAARKLGLTEAPCVYADDLSEEEVKAFRLADNRTGEFAQWDDDKLNIELDAINADMTVFGFDARPVDDVREDDCDGAPPPGAIARRGDVWLLGRHRLLCGDAADPDDVARLMDGALADMVLLDPPEALSFDATGGDESALGELVTAALTASDANMKPGASFYLFHTDSNAYLFRGACRGVGWTIRQCLVWNYGVAADGCDYRVQHMPILYGWKNGTHVWASNRKQTTVLNIDRAPRSRACPWMKPVLLCDYLIQNNTKGADIVLDPFAGAGATLIAAEQNQRTCYALEIEPRFVDLAVSRYMKLAGKRAEVNVLRDGQYLTRAQAKGESGQ